MPYRPLRDDLVDRRRTRLLLFYLAALLSVIAVSLAGRIPSFRTLLLILAVAGAGAAMLFILRFLWANDEHERQINYRALTFAFVGTLAFSAAIGFHIVSWFGIPPLMIILWSLGLILYSWRYR